MTVSKQLKRAVFGAWSLLALGGWAPGGWATPGADSTAIPSVVGRLEVLDGIASSELPQPRRAWVLLPPDYDPARRYAVLYATDGQDLFDEAMAPGGEELGLDELFAARPAGIAPLLVVGLEASAHALLEYSPPGTRDGACADALVRLLTEVVKPLVDQRYSTVNDARRTCILGRGAGALLAVYAVWTRADVFGSGVAVDLPELPPAALPPASPAAARAPRPRLWIAVAGGDVAERPSSTGSLTTLQSGATVTYVVASPHTARLTAVAAGLRACLPP